mgnify:FL=1
MKYFYIEVRNDNNEYVWVKFVLTKYNELTLDNLVLFLNQYLINTNPSKVFFDYPNILFQKISNTEYKSYNNKSKIKTITVEDKDAVYTQTYSSYSAMKNALYNLLLYKRKDTEWIK